MTQAEAILVLLAHRGPMGLTPLEALELVGTMRLAARVAELQAEGYDITNEWTTTPNGKRVARYVLHQPVQAGFWK